MRELKRLGADASERSREAAAALEAAARREGLLDVAVGNVASPVGRLLVAVTPRGLVRVAYPEETRVLEELAATLSPRVLESAAATDDVRRGLEGVFGPKRAPFAPAIDRRPLG